MNNSGNWLLLIGAIFILLGLVLKLVPGIKLFHLPGDIVVKKENVTFYFPITTMLLLSLLLSLVLYIASRLLR
jgi:Ca2+/Na+ antiporter